MKPIVELECVYLKLRLIFLAIDSNETNKIISNDGDGSDTGRGPDILTRNNEFSCLYVPLDIKIIQKKHQKAIS